MTVYVDFCRKCKEWLDEKLLDVSHDIPKYMGGIDLDGRHKLCKECHNKYEKEVVVECLKYFGVDWEKEYDIQYYIMAIKEQCIVPLYKRRCQEAAWRISNKWFQ